MGLQIGSATKLKQTRGGPQATKGTVLAQDRGRIGAGIRAQRQGVGSVLAADRKRIGQGIRASRGIAGGGPLFSQRQSGIDARNEFRNAATEASVLTQFSPNFRGSKEAFFQNRQDAGLRSVRNQTVLHFGIRQRLEEQRARERDSIRKSLGDSARFAIAERNAGLTFQHQNRQSRLAAERLGLEKESIGIQREGLVFDR